MSDIVLDRMLRTQAVVHDDAVAGWDLDGADVALMETILAEPVAVVPAVPRQRRRWARRLPVVGAVAAAAALVLAVSVFGPLGGPGSASPAAAAVLNQAAGAVQADPPARPGQFWRIETDAFRRQRGLALDTSSPEDTSVLVRTRKTEWVPVGQQNDFWWDQSSQVLRVISGKPDLVALNRIFSPEPKATRRVTTGTRVATWQDPTNAWLAALPRDPVALRGRLYHDSAGAGRSRDGEVLVYVADVLRSGRVPADLRRSLYQVLTTVPGMEVTNTTATVSGRPGVALGRLESMDGERQEIVIDPATGAFVGERTVYEDGLTTGTAVRRSVVDEVPADIRDRAITQRCSALKDGGVECS